MKSPAAIVPPQHDLAVKFLSSQVDGHAIWHYVPLAAHAVLSKLLKPGVAEAEVRDRAQEQMDILHANHPELSDLLRHKVETPRELVRQ